MPPRLLVTLALAAWVSGVVCGCGERAREVSPLSDSHGVSVPPGSAAAAEVGAEPQPLPADIPIPEGLHATSVTSQEPGSLVALFTGELEPEDVARVFAEGLRAQGWAIDESHAKGSGSDLGLFARKNERMASVIVTRLSGKLHVELGIWSPKN